MSVFPVRRRWLSLDSNPTPSPSCESLVGEFVVATFNLLAQTMVKRELFPYSTNKALKRSHRVANLLKELFHEGNVQADVLCLQEVDVDMYQHELRPAFQRMGYDSRFVRKQNEKKHSIAMAWSSKKFRLALYEQVDFNDLAFSESDPSELEVQNVAQIAALDWIGSDGGGGVIISNTHLFWNPLYSWTRTLQACELLCRVRRLSLRLPVAYPCVFAGDFNSTPDNCVFRFLTERKFSEEELRQFLTPATHTSSKSRTEMMDFDITNEFLIQNHTDESSPQHVQRLSRVRATMDFARLCLPVLRSAYGSYEWLVPDDVKHHVLHDYTHHNCKHRGHPPLTTCGKWMGCIDHIFVVAEEKKSKNAADENEIDEKTKQASVSVNVSANPWTVVPVKILEIPTSHELLQFGGLPDERLSSDHVSIMSLIQLHRRSSFS